MDTIQLTLILRKDKYTRGVFHGVYPSDKLPTTVSSFPALFIANVDTNDKPGSHLVAFFLLPTGITFIFTLGYTAFVHVCLVTFQIRFSSKRLITYGTLELFFVSMCLFMLV